VTFLLQEGSRKTFEQTACWRGKYPVALLLRVELVKNARALTYCAPGKLFQPTDDTCALAQNIETRRLGASVQLKLSADGFNISISFQWRCNYSTKEFFFNFVATACDTRRTRDPLSPVGKELQFTISLSFHSLRCLSMRKHTFCQDFFLPSDK